MTNTTSAYGSDNTLSAFFDSQHDAEHAVSRLKDAGIPESNIRLVPGYESDDAIPAEEVHQGFFESLANFFMPDEDRYSYAEGLRRGGYLVTVSGTMSADLSDKALDILDDEGAVNLDEREADWKSEGWGGYNSEAYGSAAGAGNVPGSTAGYAAGAAGGSDWATTQTSRNADFDTTRSSALTDEEVIPVVEEELRIGKRDVNLGRVRVRSYVREEPVSENVTLRDERVHIERRPVDRALTGTEAAFTDRTIEAEEHAEEAVVSKTARVTEEISLRRDATERQEQVTDTVRRTEVEVEDDRDLNSANRLGTTDRR